MLPTSFIGRDAALAELDRRVQAARAVTVIGPAGVGKTRLVREFMTGRAGVFVDVSGVRTSAELRARVATAFGVQLVGDNDERLLAAIAARGDAIIALDDVEHVAAAVTELVAGWLADTSARVVIASRIRLGLDGEHLFDLQPLGKADAVSLFAERATAVRADFAATPADAELIARIVDRLECLPLAIELAAARMRILSLRQLTDQLSARLDVLAAGDRSIRGALDTSWELLAPWQREALAQCTVFRGGFSLEAAQATLALTEGHTAIDAVQALCEHSLLQAYEPVHGPSALRYRLYQSVHAYGVEKLDDDVDLRERHAAYYAGRARDEDSFELASDVENLIDAHRHSLANAAERALTIATALGPVIKRCGPMELRITTLDRALAAAEKADVSAAALIDGLLARAEAATELSRFDRARQDRERALALAESTGDELREARSVAGLGRLAWHNGDIAQAETQYARALPIFERLDDREGIALTLLTTANVHAVRGDSEQARTHYERVLSILRAAGIRPDLLALALGNLGNMEQNVDELEAAEGHLEQAIETAAACGEHYYESTFLLQYAAVALARNQLDQAREICQRALAKQRALGNRRWEGCSLGLLAEIAELRSETKIARSGYEDAVAVLREFGHPLLEGVTLCKLARFEAVGGRLEVAKRRLARARERLAGDSPLKALAIVCEAEIARCAGNMDESRALADTVTEAARQSWEVRSALARLRGELPGSVGPLLMVGRDGRWFETSEGKRVDLSRRRALRLVFAALATSKKALAIDELLGLGWPGETVTTDAGHTRVYTAIATLRRMGLRDVLLRRDDGYLISPHVTVQQRD